MGWFTRDRVVKLQTEDGRVTLVKDGDALEIMCPLNITDAWGHVVAHLRGKTSWKNVRGVLVATGPASVDCLDAPQE